jgi:hypothetical protein
MVDFESVGKAGLMIQYEDVISIMGYNIAEYCRKNKVNDKFESMSHEDMLLSYLNRETYDINRWIKETFDYDLDVNQLLSSRIMMQPNFVYAYKVFMESAKQGVTNLSIYSNKYSDAIEAFLPSFEIDTLTYQHGNLVDWLNKNPNSTFITSNPDSIQLCKEVSAPFVLTLVDDFIYLKDILLTRVDEELRQQNKLVFFTGVISGGLTNVVRD